MLFKMSDEKAVDGPAVVITQAEPKRRNTKKYVIIAVSAILAAVIILVAILVGMYMFSEAQKEIIKYTLAFNDKVKQDVVSDPNTNVVQYHVQAHGYEAWIVNDFNKDIQVVKIHDDKETTCYMNVLNRTNAMDPSMITKPESTDDAKGAHSLIYSVSDTPVIDTSFLSKAATDMCKGISIYWVYPQCAQKGLGSPNMTEPTPDPRSKRQTYYDYSPWYILSYRYYAGYNVPCYTGCCRTICACSIRISVAYYGGIFYCSWYSSSCPPYIYYNPIYDYCSNAPSGIRCPNRYPTYPPTC